MARTKIDMVMAIIELLYDGSDLDLREEHRTRNRMQLKLQKLSNKNLANMLGMLEESLVCRHYFPGKGYCRNPSQRKKTYCEEHDLARNSG
jgi:hypothetical protein